MMAKKAPFPFQKKDGDKKSAKMCPKCKKPLDKCGCKGKKGYS